MKQIVKIALPLLLIITLYSCSKEDEINQVTVQDKNAVIFNPALQYGILTDQEGNRYRTIVIGTQTWMAENLRTTRYSNGDLIQESVSRFEWPSMEEGAWCAFDNRKNSTELQSYGLLYNFQTISDPRQIAPEGWHIPSEKEWQILITYLGGAEIAGAKLKEAGVLHWAQTIPQVNNNSGFTALPAGYRDLFMGSFTGKGDQACWWSSTSPSQGQAISFTLYGNTTTILSSEKNRQSGLSIRCIKD